MHCLACRYTLTGLTSSRCPECGRMFDPRDASTYARTKSELRFIWIVIWALAGLLWPLLLSGWVYITFFTARLVLGRWPSGGGDDPARIPVVATVRLIALAFFFLTPFALTAGYCGLLAMASRSWCIGIGCAAAVLAAYISLWLVGDPVHAWSWFMD